MARWLLILFLLAAVLTLTRFLVIVLREPAERERLASELDALPGAAPVEAALESWRTRFGRVLWVNLVGIPLALFLLLVAIGEYT